MIVLESISRLFVSFYHEFELLKDLNIDVRQIKLLVGVLVLLNVTYTSLEICVRLIENCRINDEALSLNLFVYVDR